MPFYCPPDSGAYLDLSFFEQMRQLGAQNAPLAQAYVVAHEWGHHIQNLTGQFDRYDTRHTGENSPAVRMELQADCYAGMWVNHATTTVDPESGQVFLKQPSREEIQSALTTAKAIGDDHIQQQSTGRVSPEGWTHGSSQQRMKWFTIGMKQGSLRAYDIFAAAQP